MASNQSTWSWLSEPAILSAEKGTAQLGEIVVFIDGHAKAAGILEFAGVLAEEHGARLISVFMQPEPPITPAQTFARGKGMLSLIEEHRAQLEGIEADYRALFDDTVRRYGIRSESEWRSLPYLSSEVGVHAYYADLVVIARPEPAGQTAGPPGLAESLVLSSGRPIILFPPSGTVSRVRRILVGWNATRESIRAVADALPLLARHLARHGAQVGVRRLSSGEKDVGRLLLSQADAFGADLLVMGAYGHSQLSEWVFGGVTRTVLYEAGLPVLMSR